MTYWACTELCEAFTFLVENIYVQLDDMVYQQIGGDSYGHKLCSTYSRPVSVFLKGFYAKPPEIQTG